MYRAAHGFSVSSSDACDIFYPLAAMSCFCQIHFSFSVLEGAVARAWGEVVIGKWPGVPKTSKMHSQRPRKTAKVFCLHAKTPTVANGEVTQGY